MSLEHESGAEMHSRARAETARHHQADPEERRREPHPAADPALARILGVNGSGGKPTRRPAGDER